MSPRPARIVQGSLCKKGFVRVTDGDHQAFQLYVNGKRTGISTYYSHGARELNDYILGSMAKHLRLSRAQFEAFIDCTLSMEAYIEILRAQGAIKG